MIRRLLAAVVLVGSSLVLLGAPAGARPGTVTPAGATVAAMPAGASAVPLGDGEELPGTTLEAEQRDDGSTSMAKWVIGSGIAAIVVVVAGGLLLKRRS